MVLNYETEAHIANTPIKVTWSCNVNCSEHAGQKNKSMQDSIPNYFRQKKRRKENINQREKLKKSKRKKQYLGQKILGNSPDF